MQLNTTKQLSKKVIAILGLAILAACGSDTQIKTTFNATQDIQEGESVYLSDQVVGEVVDVDQSADKTIVTLELTEEGATKVRQKGAVVVNRLKQNKPLEIYNLKESQPTVENGDELKGLDSMFQLGAWMVGENLDLGSNTLLGYVNAFQEYLSGDKWQQDKQVIEEGVKQLGKEAESMAGALTQELSEATGDLGQVEQEAAKVVDQLGVELAPVMGELAKSGKVLVDQLGEFTRNIEQQDAEGKELGTTIMESLAKTLQTVNESMQTAVDDENVEAVKDSTEVAKEVASEVAETVQPEQEIKVEPVSVEEPVVVVPEAVKEEVGEAAEVAAEESK